MSDFDPIEDMADMAVDCLNDFIDTERQFVTAEHDLLDKLLQFENILPHLESLITPAHLTHAKHRKGNENNRFILLKSATSLNRIFPYP